MPKKKPESPKTSTSASAVSATSSSVSSGSSTLFTPKTALETLPLLALPDDILEKINSYLDRKELIKLAQTSHEAYRSFYPTIKAAMVKVLKDLVKQDDTLRINQLLQGNPNLQLRRINWILRVKLMRVLRPRLIKIH